MGVVVVPTLGNIRSGDPIVPSELIDFELQRVLGARGLYLGPRRGRTTSGALPRDCDGHTDGPRGCRTPLAGLSAAHGTARDMPPLQCRIRDSADARLLGWSEVGRVCCCVCQETTAGQSRTYQTAYTALIRST